LPLPPIKNPFNLPTTIQAIRKIRNIIRTENIKLIHCNASGGITTVSAIAARAEHIPFIWHVRTNETAPLSDALNAALSNIIIVISKSVRKRFFAMPNIMKKIVMIYNGVNIAAFDRGYMPHKTRKTIGLSQGSFVITTVGRFHPIKGFKYLIRAAQIVSDSTANVEFVIVGMNVHENNNYLQHLKALAKSLGIEKKIKFLAHRNDIPSILAASDLFVLPSPNEAFGRVIIEAMACRRPIIAVNRGGPKEIIEDLSTGILIKPRSAKDLAEKIMLLISNTKLRQNIAINGYHKAVKDFNIFSHSAKIEKLYESLIKHPQ